MWSRPLAPRATGVSFRSWVTSEPNLRLTVNGRAAAQIFNLSVSQNCLLRITCKGERLGEFVRQADCQSAIRQIENLRSPLRLARPAPDGATTDRSRKWIALRTALAILLA